MGVPCAVEPDLPVEHQRPAVYVVREEPAVESRTQAPGPPVGDRENMVSGEPADRGRPIEQRPQLSGEASGTVPIVVVPVGDAAPSREVTAAITLLPDTRTGRHPLVADARIGGKRALERGVPVVEHDELGIRDILPQEITRRLHGQRYAVAR